MDGWTFNPVMNFLSFVFCLGPSLLGSFRPRPAPLTSMEETSALTWTLCSPPWGCVLNTTFSSIS